MNKNTKWEIEHSVEQGKIYTFNGREPQIHSSVFLAAGSVVIGDVELAENVSVWFNTVIRGDVERIRVGRNTNIQDNTVIHVTHFANPVWVGENVTIGHAAVLHGCTIQDNALVGIKAVVLDRAVVGEGALVAAGAVVRPGTVIPPGMLAAGVPAKVLRPLTPDEKLMVAEGHENYINYVRHYRKETEPVRWDRGSFAGRKD
ncbi:MAG: gamma carbonic anhydrase family protein [Acidobacteriota bacterium]